MIYPEDRAKPITQAPTPTANRLQGLDGVLSVPEGVKGGSFANEERGQLAADKTERTERVWATQPCEQVAG